MANATNPKVDFYFHKKNQWQAEVNELRKIILAVGLNEELKWGCPCYTLDGANIVLIHDFKTYCALLFFKGALMKDPNSILIQQTKNVQSARQIRFTHIEQINDMKKMIQLYVKEAMAIEKKGLKVELKKPEQFEMADEFKTKLDKNPALKKAFAALTPGRQRAYLLHFASAKQSATRAARVEKCTPDIMKGKGLND